jgi:hypothetical protein
MADSKIPGNIIGVKIGNQWLQCQAESTLNMTGNVSEDAPCKNLDGDEDDEDVWVTRTVDSKDWNITVNQSLLADSLAAENEDIDLGGLFTDGSLYVDSVQFANKANTRFSDYNFVYSGPAILTSFSITAGGTGANTTAATFTGNGKLSRVKTPVTT